MKITKYIVSILLIVLLLATGCKTAEQAADDEAEDQYAGKKVLLLNSYHDGFWWSEREENTALEVFEGTGVDVKIHYMDTKNNPGEEFKTQAGAEAKQVIDEFNPDVILTMDDNAFKYVMLPYYINTETPIVFAGINGDSKIYGTPYPNVAGIEESPLVNKMVENIAHYTKGDRVGFISQDILSAQRNVEFYERTIEGGIDEVALLQTFDEWKARYIEMQDQVDYIIMGPCGNLEGWDFDEAEAFVLENAKIPSVTQGDVMMGVSLVGIALSPEEHGRWSAETTLDVLRGKTTQQIGIIQNKEGDLLLNVNIANKLGIVLEPEQIKTAEEIYE